MPDIDYFKIVEIDGVFYARTFIGTFCFDTYDKAAEYLDARSKQITHGFIKDTRLH